MQTEPNHTTKQARPEALPGLEFFYKPDCECDVPCVGVKVNPSVARPLLLAGIADQTDESLMIVLGGLLGDPADLPPVMLAGFAHALAEIRHSMKEEMGERMAAWREANPKEGGDK